MLHTLNSSMRIVLEVGLFPKKDLLVSFFCKGKL